ncbi:MAG TPA: sigma factor-like helix-turn-helix DNA-binding protein [Actinomycetota bacterium]|jgi:RNA polymerase sigma-70 factor (ECF subfamily)|nr:sigma factor-like helix-turn-helix DNA-binding protein [Actinomycetota bacterium]
MLEVSRSSTTIETIYRDDAARLWRALYAFGGDPEIASDALVEAFAQAIRRGEAITSPAAWIWRAAFRIASGELADRARFLPLEQDQRAAPEGADLDLVAALGRLSPNQRASVVLHHIGGYSTRETARIIGSTAGAVRVHLSMARRRLTQLLEEDDA